MAFQEKLLNAYNKVRTRGDDPARKRRVYWACYTLSFIVVAFIVLFVYPSNGRSIVWSVDGLEQYYPYFVYEGQWLREIFSNLLSGQGWQVPLWSYTLGYGSDILATLDVIFDPLNLLSGLCPEQYSEYLFQFLVVFRLYLAGAAFSLFAFRFGTGRFPTLLAALLYALCGTALAVTFWPAGAWPMVLFPLLLLGVEKILAGERPFVFILSAAALFIISYYFSYMACLFLVPYCAARVIVVKGRMGVGCFALWALRFMAFLCVGILIAGISLGPALVGLFGNERFVEGGVTVPALYSPDFYFSTIAGFMSTTGVGSDCYIGFGGLAFLACVLLFTQRKQHRLLKWCFVALVVVLFLPVCGSVLNGFNYATNRWVWAFALLVCFIVAKMLPNLLAVGSREAKALVVASLVFGIFTILVPQARTEQTVAACVVLTATLMVVIQKGLSEQTRQMGIVACLVAGLACDAFYLVSPEEGGIGKSSTPLGTMYQRLTSQSPNILVANLDDQGTWRYDADPSTLARLRNDSAVLGLSGIDFYNSFYNSYIDAYHTELGVSETNINFSYRDTGARAILDTLAGVKYFLVPAGVQPPYSYGNDEPVATGKIVDKNYEVYEAEHALPLAFVYDAQVPRSVYDGLSPAQRQESLLQGVVLEDSTLPEAQLNLESRELETSYTPGSGVTVEDGAIRVTSPGATLQLTFEGLADSETYLYADGLSYEPVSPLDSVSAETFAAMTWHQKAKLYKQNLEWTAPTDYFIKLASDKGTATRQIINSVETWHMYGGKDEWLVNMGYSDEAQSSITLTFNQAGIYRFDTLGVVCQPMASLDDHVSELETTPVENLRFGTNEITCSVDAAKEEVLFLSVPFSSGWSATVDGQPAELKRANTGFMALELQPGQHEVKLTFMTPGLEAGALATGAGVIALGAVVIGYQVLRRTRQHPDAKASI